MIYMNNEKAFKKVQFYIAQNYCSRNPMQKSGDHENDSWDNNPMEMYNIRIIILMLKKRRRSE